MGLGVWKLRVQVGLLREWVNVIATNAPVVRTRFGKGIAAQARECMALRAGIGKLKADEYYGYGLYDDQVFTWDEKKNSLGDSAKTTSSFYSILSCGRPSLMTSC